MGAQYILGIDGGTQSTKVALFDLDGREVCAAAVKLRPLTLSDGGVAEHPDDDLWDSLTLACRDLLARFAGDPRDIIGVGLGSIRCCRALLRADGTLAAPVQSWMDARLSRPFADTDPAVSHVTTATGYLTRRLTDETRDTRCNSVGPWPIDPISLEWRPDGDGFDAFGIPRRKLFDLVDPASVLGTITKAASAATGLPLGLPVVATANDKAVEALGAGLRDDGTVLISLGTYITAMVLTDDHPEDTTRCWGNPGALPGEVLCESAGIRRGMSTVSWIVDLMGSSLAEAARQRGLSPEAYLNHLAATEVPPGCGGLLTVPNWLARPGHPQERGVMIGFDGGHGGPHMFRSILEGIAMTMKTHVAAMCAERDVPLTRLVLSGGGSNGDLFMQIFADVFGVPAHRNEVPGSAALGAAICTAIALKRHDGREAAVARMVRRRDTFHPVPDHVALYARVYDGAYSDLADGVDPVLRRMHQTFRGLSPDG